MKSERGKRVSRPRKNMAQCGKVFTSMLEKNIWKKGN